MVTATIIIDCGRKSGLGRVRRSLTLVDAFCQHGVIPHLYLSDAEGACQLEAAGYTYSVGLPQTFKSDLLIVDTCTHSSEEINALCAQAKVSCVIDDLGERPVSCDYIINPNLYASGVDYSHYNVKKVFHGPSHSLLAKAFFDNVTDLNKRRGIVVSFGGTDDGTLAATVAELLAARTDEPIYVPIPEFLPMSARLLDAAKRHPSIHPLVEPDMPKLLGASRVYVGAAGATLLEALASGCAVCVAATQKDQHKNVAYLPSIGVPALEVFHPDAMVAMVEKALQSKMPDMLFNANASGDIAHIALQAFHRAA